jgi:hypothetical protein
MTAVVVRTMRAAMAPLHQDTRPDGLILAIGCSTKPEPSDPAAVVQLTRTIWKPSNGRRSRLVRGDH